MFKSKVIVCISLAAVFIASGAYCQQVNKNQQVNTIAGTVTSIDPEAGIMNVQTDQGNMLFYISVETNIFRKTQPMASIEIAKRDSIIVQYFSANGKNNTVTIVDNMPISY